MYLLIPFDNNNKDISLLLELSKKLGFKPEVISDEIMQKQMKILLSSIIQANEQSDISLSEINKEIELYRKEKKTLRRRAARK